VKESAVEAARETRDEAVEFAREMRAKAIEVATEEKHRAAEKICEVGQALDRAADKLHEEEDRQMAGYAHRAAARLRDFSDELEHRDFSSLKDQVEDYARRRPAAVLAASFIGGVALSRFLKSSRRRQENEHGD
jgi:hypothetical protein